MNALARTWSMWIVRGIASVLFGVLTFLQPGASIGAIVLVYGIYAIADGALLLGFAFRYQGRKAPYVVRGLLSLAAGLVAFLLPGPTALAFYVLIGAWAITAGAAELAIAVAIRKDGFRVTSLVLAGILSLGCGVVLLALPMAGILALISVIAAYAIINGAALVVAGCAFTPSPGRWRRRDCADVLGITVLGCLKEECHGQGTGDRGAD